jgi:hypothetical protein
LNALLPFAKNEQLPALATLAEDICVAFGGSFMTELQLSRFRNPVTTLSQFLDLSDDPSQGLSIGKMSGPSQEKALLKASEHVRTLSYADGRPVQELLDAFQASPGTSTPFAFDGTPVFSLSPEELGQLRELAEELTFADRMTRHELLACSREIGSAAC